jgi:plastocyanin
MKRVAWALGVLAVCALCLSVVAIGATGRRASHRACRPTHHGHCAARGARHTAGRGHRHKRHGSHATAKHPPLAPTTNGSSLPGTATAPAGSSGSPSGSEAPSSTEGTADGSESGGSGGASEEGSGSAAPARLQVTAKEFSLTLSRPAVAAGAVTIELVDGGQDEHNLHIRPASGGPDVGAFPNTLPGRHLDVTFSLAPGTYTLYCSIPAHEELGMKASFTVR